MLPAILTTLLWGYCLIPARQSVAQLGENAANFWRLAVAVACMGALALAGGMALGREAFLWFFLSGIIGFGFGDLGVFFALPRIGSRLTLLMAQCVAAPIAGVAEWLWLGTTIHPGQAVAIGIALAGIALALFPEHERANARQRHYLPGILFGTMAAFGQGMGAVCSRKAFTVLAARGGELASASPGDYILLGATSGFARLLGGILFAGSFLIISRCHAPWRTPADPARAGDPLPAKTRNILLHAATGPILGIICYQWALATTPSALVQPIVAMAPLAVLPMALRYENDRPSLRALAGTAIAVLGVVFLALIG